MRKYAFLTIASIFLLAGYVVGVQAAPVSPGPEGKNLPTYAPPGEIIGMSVSDVNGEPVGQLENVVFDWSSSRIGYGVISYEGNSYYVPWSVVRFNPDETSLRLQVDRQKVVTGPQVKETPVSRTTGIKIHEHYGLAPYWGETVRDKPQE